MCGIFGTYGFCDPKLMELMARSLNHRGPDEKGTYQNGEVFLRGTPFRRKSSQNGKFPFVERPLGENLLGMGKLSFVKRP